MRVTFLALLLLASQGLTSIAVGQEKPKKEQCDSSNLGGECGYFWGADFNTPEEPEEEILKIIPPEPVATPPEPKEEEQEKDPFEIAKKANPCLHEDTWSPACGFVDPKGDWDFQKKMGDQLIRRMAMNSTDASAVKEYQKYATWVVRQASQVAQMWMFNLSQDPDMQPGLAHYPVSQFGVQMAARQRRGYEEEVYATLREDEAFFIFFSRSDCIYCHQMKFILKSLEADTGIPIFNASLDETCIEGFSGEACVTAPESLAPAAMMKINVVPAMLLYIPTPESKEEFTSIRISTGLESAETMKMRIRLFAVAARAAALKGMESNVDGQAAVDFTRRSFESGDTGSTIVNPRQQP